MLAPPVAMVGLLVAAASAAPLGLPAPVDPDVVCLLPGCLENLVLPAVWTVLGLASKATALACAVNPAPCEAPGSAVCVLDLLRDGRACFGLGPFEGNASATSARYLTGLPGEVPGVCPPTWFEDPASEPLGVWGACGLQPPSKPDFRITVADELGRPVTFRWFASPGPGSSCDWGSGTGTVVAHLRPWCQGVVIGVLIEAPALPGRIVLTPL